MIQRTIYVRATRAEVVASLLRVPTEAVAGGPIADSMLMHCGFAILGRIHRAFLVKAKGGTDEAGEKWEPLSPYTIAYRMTTRKGKHRRSKVERSRPNRPSQALNSKQQERWWEVYRQVLAQYKGNKGHAAAVAWVKLKEEGAKTLFDKYSNYQVDILIDSHDLVDSLSPEGESEYKIFRVSPGEAEVGTSRPGASHHHRGIPGRLPQRRLWPEPKKWPNDWWGDILGELTLGVVDLAVCAVAYASKTQ